MVNGSSTKLPIQLLSTEFLEVVYGVGPQVQYIVPGEGVPLLDHDHFGPKKG